jgi:hypothetical protein
MGYAITAYVVDIGKLRAVVGSKKAALARRTKENNEDRIEENKEWFDSYIEKGAPTLDVAIDEVIAGKPSKKKFGFQYGYAVEVLTADMGKQVDTDYLGIGTFEECSDLVEDKAASKLLRRVARGCNGLEKPFVAIPKPADFPGLAALDVAECAAALAAVKAIPKEAVKDADIDEESLEQLVDMLAAAKKAKKGIAFFYY